MAGINTTNNSAMVPEIWLNNALGRLRQLIQIAPRITSDNDMGINQQFSKGNILSIPVRGSVTSNLVSEGGNFTIQSPTASSVLVTLNKHREASITITSEMEAEQNQDTIGGYMQDMVKAMASGIESDLHALFAAGVLGGNTIAATGNITEPQVLAARKLLIDNLVDPLDDKYAVLSTTQGNAIRQSTNTARYDATGRADNIANATVGERLSGAGAVGHTLGFDVLESQLVQVNSGVSNNLFFAKDSAVIVTRALPLPRESEGAHGTVMQDPQTGMWFRLFTAFNPSNGLRQLTLDCLYGYSMLRANHAAMIQATGG